MLRCFERANPQFQLFAQLLWAEQDRQKVNALRFAEIEQTRQPGGEQPPTEPLVVGESAQLAAVLPDDQSLLLKFQAQAGALDQQK